MEKLSIAVCLLVLLAMPAWAVAHQAEVPFASLFDPDAQPETPSRITWSPDGASLAYVWDDGEGDGLWVDRPTAGSHRLVLRLPGDDEKEQRLHRILWLSDGSGLLLHGKQGLARLDLPAEGEGTLRPLVATGEDDEDFKLSPDGSHVAFVRQANLWWLDLESGRAERLTKDGEEGKILNGKTDWVYWEELWGRNSTGHWWSPDSRHLAFYRFDDRLVSTYPLVDFTRVPYPEIEEQRYPKAGERNPEVKVGILPLEGESREIVWLQTEGPEESYLARVHWLPGGAQVAVERLNREQNRLDLLLCDAATGACKILLTEQNDTWVRVDDFTTFLEDGSFLWASQRSGWNQILRFDAAGQLLNRVSDPAHDVTGLAGVDEKAGTLIYTGFPTVGALNAKDRLVVRAPLAGGEAVVLAQGEGNHEATSLASSGLWVHSFDDARTPRRLTVDDGAGNQVAELPARDPIADLHSGLPRWEFLTIPGPDGPLPARLLKPAGFNPKDRKKKYPAIVYHYGCPESQVVADRWSGRDLWHRWMASRGYAVFMLDNGQSNYFGKAGVDRGHRRFGAINLQAQLAGVEYLKSLGWVDPARLGLWGWSGGGHNTLYVLTNAPGTFKAGVSGAPVTNWRLYDTIWTERYLDHPKDNPEGYAASSAITYADQLKDHLLIVHGTADDNVHPQNTLAFIDQLIKAEIPFEDAIYPRQKHGFRDKAMNHFYRRMTAFFDQQLR